MSAGLTRTVASLLVPVDAGLLVLPTAMVSEVRTAIGIRPECKIDRCRRPCHLIGNVRCPIHVVQRISFGHSCIFRTVPVTGQYGYKK